MIARGIGYAVAGQNYDNDPEKGDQAPSNDAGLGTIVVRCLKKAVACLKRGPDLSDLGELPGRIGSQTDR